MSDRRPSDEPARSGGPDDDTPTGALGGDVAGTDRQGTLGGDESETSSVAIDVPDSAVPGGERRNRPRSDAGLTRARDAAGSRVDGDDEPDTGELDAGPTLARDAAARSEEGGPGGRTPDRGPDRVGEPGRPGSRTGRDNELSLIAAARMQAQRRATPVIAGAMGKIPGYTIIREIHRGGQGVVYLATQEGTGRQVAIKVMREGPFASGHDRVRFDREVRILAQLNNPNIVAIHDSGSVGGGFYYVMDYIAGMQLDDYVRENQLPLEETLRLFITICQAVNSAHLRGVIHRDLKPSNIRVTPTGDPRVLDFGLAKVADTSEPGAGPASLPTQMTITGQFIGSLPWASPEQARGDAGRIDVRTDVYSLGVMLYQLVLDRFPYDVDGPMREVMTNICDVDPMPPRRIRADLSRDLETLILRPLSKRREDRYQTAGELARELERYLAGEPIEAKRGSGRYMLRMMLRRNWGKSVAVAGVLALILAGLLGLTLGYVELARQQESWLESQDELMARIKGLERENRRLRLERDEAIRGFVGE